MMKKLTTIGLIAFITVIFINGNLSAQYVVKPSSIKLSEIQEIETKDLRPSYETVWSETFNGGLPGSWQNVNNNGFCSFQHTYAGPQGPFSVGIPPINSSTAGNGFMILDSDLCNAGNTEYELVDAYIQSPVINLSAHTNVGLRFEHFFRFCCNPSLIELKVLVSNNGVNWVSFDVSNGLSPNNTSSNPLVTVLNISAVAGGRETVWVRFYKKGASQYFWMIDDVSIISLTDNDLELVDVRHEGYTIIPGGIKNNINIAGTVKNSGSMAQTNVQLSVDVNEYLYSLESNLITSLNPSQEIIVPISDPFVIPGKGVYELLYNVEQTQTDQIPSNNQKQSTIIVGDSVYARDLGQYTSGNLVWPAQQGISHTGNMFFIGKDVDATSISVALHENSSAGEEISAVLYQYSELLGFQELSRSQEYEIVAENINSVEGDAIWVTIPLDEITLDNGVFYLAAIEYNSNNVAIAADNSVWQPENASFSNVDGTWNSETATPMVRLNLGSNVGDCNIIAYFDVTNDFCGYNNGSISALPLSGTPPFTYEWDTDPVSFNSTITGLGEGLYTVTITDKDNCVNEYSVEIEQKDIEYNLEVIPSACNGANGVAIVTPFTGQEPFTFLWDTDPAQSNAMAVGLAPGEYNVTITDANSCEIIVPVTVTSINAVTLSYETISPVCLNNNGSIEVTPITGTGPFSYSWSNDENFDMQIQDNLIAGNYIITVTDDNECIGTVNVSLNANQVNLLVLADIVHTTCELPNGAILLNVTNGQAPYEYLWNNNAISAELLNIAAGNYSVSVTDAWGCQGNASFVLNNTGDALQVDIDVTNTSACGESDGSIIVSAINPGSNYTFEWSGGEIGPEITGLSSGLYTVTVTDLDGGCQADFEVFVSDNGIPGVTIVKNNVTCHGYNNGSIAVSVSGGDYDYLWSNESTEQSISNLAPGLYTLQLTSAECFAYYEFIITQPNPLVINDVEIIQPFCHNSSDGSIHIQAVGGTSPYQYLWNDQMVGNIINDLPAGAYSVTVTDFNSCTAEKSYVLNNPLQIVIIAQVVNPEPGQNNGSIQVSVINAVGTVIYEWDSGQSGSYIDGLAPGLYTVTVTDQNGCIAQETFELFVTNISQPEFSDVISVYPNPARDFILIDFGSLSDTNWDVIVYDLKGVAQYSTKYSSANKTVKLNIGHLNSGIYIVRIMSDYGIAEKVIVIN
ncbi:MAG: T9SS type A sorting domain-containing protein [Bacteroidetes bacterium]|nr:T9SS type A sorting domain-containing protein [Bacteroidota bacterium]